MINGGDGYDVVQFLDTAATANLDLAFATRTFADIFPSDPPTDPATANPAWVDTFTSIFGDDPQTVSYASVILQQSGIPEPLNVNARGSEHIEVSLGSGNNVTQLTSGVYAFDITVYGGPGDDTFNIENGFDNRGYNATLNGEEGDDLMYVQYDSGVPSGWASVTFNGGRRRRMIRCASPVTASRPAPIRRAAPRRARAP